MYQLTVGHFQLFSVNALELSSQYPFKHGCIFSVVGISRIRPVCSKFLIKTVRNEY
jgi:hypothetical protein